MKRASLAIALQVIGIGTATHATAEEPSSAAPVSTSAATAQNTTGDNWIDTPAPAPTGENRTPAPVPRPKATVPTSTATQPQFGAPQPAPVATPPASATRAAPATTAANVDGQWVYTKQYGWVWMPYDRAYTYVGPEGNPYMYIYYPAVGWCWLYSPWVVGWGPVPYWGAHGPVRFAWYAHPWFRAPIGMGPSGHYHGGGSWHGGYGHGGYYHGGWHGGGVHRVPAFGAGRGHR
jgi:hypothetical protein